MNNDKMILAIGVTAVLMMCAFAGVAIYNSNNASNSDTADSSSSTANETAVEIPVLTSIPREIIIVQEPAKLIVEETVIASEEAATVEESFVEVEKAQSATIPVVIEEISVVEETAVEETYTDDEGYETTGASDAVTEPAAAEAAAELCTVSQYGRAIATFEDFKLAIVESVENQYGYTIVEMFVKGGFTTVNGDIIDSEERFSEMADVICENDGMTKDTFMAMYYDLIASFPTVDEINEEETAPVEENESVDANLNTNIDGLDLFGGSEIEPEEEVEQPDVDINELEKASSTPNDFFANQNK